MFGFGKKKKDAAQQPAATPSASAVAEPLVAPATGQYKKLADVPDPVFAQGTMGEGFAVVPEDGVVVSPVAGEVAILQDTLHAFLVKTPAGAEVLVHVGIDTVELGGRGFTARVSRGDTVTAGQPVLEVDWAAIASEVPATDVMVMVTNSKKFALTKNNDAAHPVTAGEQVGSAAAL